MVKSEFIHGRNEPAIRVRFLRSSRPGGTGLVPLWQWLSRAELLNVYTSDGERIFSELRRNIERVDAPSKEGQ